MSLLNQNPMERAVRWLAAQANFPASRLTASAESLLLVGLLAEAQGTLEAERHLVQTRNGAQDAALRAHALRRSRVHYKCDNSAKV